MMNKSLWKKVTGFFITAAVAVILAITPVMAGVFANGLFWCEAI